MTSPSLSVIIVTYKRPQELSNALTSVIKQTILPQEIFVIDNGNDQATHALIEKRKQEFAKKSIALYYVNNDRDDSLSVARNMGVELSHGSFISFVDDDIILGKDYHERIFKVFRQKPQALVVQGYNQTTKEAYLNQGKTKGRKDLKEIIMGTLVRFYNAVFQASCSFEKERCRVLPSLSATYPSPDIDKIINCEWIVNAAAVYKRSVLEEFKFDEQLKRFAWGIDQDHPYRIFKKYPKALFLTPFAHWWDKSSPKGRLPHKELIYMMEVYELYVFYKIIDQTLKNKAIYFWRKMGNLLVHRIFFNVLTLGRGNPKVGFLKMKYATGAFFYTLRHRKELKQGDLNFFNKTLSEESEEVKSSK